MFFYRLDLARFGILITNDADRLARTLSRPRVGRSSLAAYWQAPAVSNPAITIDGLEPFQVSLNFAAQITFDRNLVVRDGVNNFVQLLGGEIFRPHIRVDVCLLENAPRRR
jgi:hypothetical protein